MCHSRAGANPGVFELGARPPIYMGRRLCAGVTIILVLICRTQHLQSGRRVDSYRLNDLKITIDRRGADRFAKARYAVRYGRYAEIKPPACGW